MTIATLAAYLNATRYPSQFVPFTKSSITAIAGRHYTLWASTPNAGAAPTTAAVPAQDIAGALAQRDGATSLHLLAMQYAALGATGLGCTLWLCDRLSHQGGLSGTAAGAQTTNLATAALTRYTDGIGVWAAVDIYTQIGATGATFTTSYTGADLGAGQTSTARIIGGTGFREVNRRLIIPPAQGDRGIKAVASLTLSGTTGTAGNFGITLFKPLLILPNDANAFRNGVFRDGLLGRGGIIPEIKDGACLELMVVAPNTSTGTIAGNAIFGEGT